VVKVRITIKIERELIDAVRERFPELRDISSADVVRVIIRKVLEGGGRGTGGKAHERGDLQDP